MSGRRVTHVLPANSLVIGVFSVPGGAPFWEIYVTDNSKTYIYNHRGGLANHDGLAGRNASGTFFLVRAFAGSRSGVTPHAAMDNAVKIAKSELNKGLVGYLVGLLRALVVANHVQFSGDIGKFAEALLKFTNEVAKANSSPTWPDITGVDKRYFVNGHM